MKKYILQMFKSFTLGVIFTLGAILGLVGVYAALNWTGLTANVTSDTVLTTDLWNNTIGTLKTNIDALDTRMTNVESSGGGSASNPFSFANNADGTPSGTTAGGNSIVLDSTTGLMWQSDGQVAGTKTWADANTYCGGLNLGGYSDWRLPEIGEMRHLSNNLFKQQGNNTRFSSLINRYWSYTTHILYTSKVWTLSFEYGSARLDNKVDPFYTLCVR